MGITIKINMDKKCVRCGKKGAMENGHCLKCVTDYIVRKRKKEVDK